MSRDLLQAAPAKPRLLVTGDRNWSDEQYLFTRLDELHEQYHFAVLIEGCARGADSMAEIWAFRRRVDVEHHPADWSRYGRRAGPIRNQEMLESGVDLVVAFHPDLTQSRGTVDMIRRAKRAGIRVIYFAGHV